MTLTGGDGITIGNIPDGLDVYAGYTGGWWPTYLPLAAKYPSKLHLAYAVSAWQWGDCLDVENGDATPDQAAGWIDRWTRHNTPKPALYTSASMMGALILAAGHPRDRFLALSAHYTNVPHICSSAQCWPSSPVAWTADGTQWSDNGGAWDSLLFQDYFFTVPSPPAPPGIIRLPTNNYPDIGGRMSSVIARLPVAANGEGWGVFDGGINSDPGAASLFPAIPFNNVNSVVGWCDDPTHDHPDTATPVVGIQNRNSWLFVKATGAVPGAQTAVAYVTYS